MTYLNRAALGDLSSACSGGMLIDRSVRAYQDFIRVSSWIVRGNAHRARPRLEAWLAINLLAIARSGAGRESPISYLPYDRFRRSAEGHELANELPLTALNSHSRYGHPTARFAPQLPFARPAVISGVGCKPEAFALGTGLCSTPESGRPFPC